MECPLFLLHWHSTQGKNSTTSELTNHNNFDFLLVKPLHNSLPCVAHFGSLFGLLIFPSSIKIHWSPVEKILALEHVTVTSDNVAFAMSNMPDIGGGAA